VENIAFIKKSANSKTGPIPVSITNASTCPDVCPFKASNICYAKSGHLAIHWAKVNNYKTGLSVEDFVKEVKALPAKTFWRHNTAGDLFGQNNTIDGAALIKLIRANKGKAGFTYTHKPVLDSSGVSKEIYIKNRKLIKAANNNGFTVNLSANNYEEADKLLALGIGPVVTTMRSDALKDERTPVGTLVKVCPAVVSDKYTCSNCKICQKVNRKFVVGFPAHGINKNKLNKLLEK